MPLTGVIAGIVIPLIAFTLFFIFTRNGLTLPDYFSKVRMLDNISEIMSVCVFSNIIIFLLFNRFDMLRASKGVLGDNNCVGFHGLRDQAFLR
jgi:hypothetical protein